MAVVGSEGSRRHCRSWKWMRMRISGESGERKRINGEIVKKERGRRAKNPAGPWSGDGQMDQASLPAPQLRQRQSNLYSSRRWNALTAIPRWLHAEHFIAR